MFSVPFQVKAQDTALESGANFSYTSVIKDKNANKDTQIDENVDVHIVDDEAFQATVSLASVSGEQDAIDSSCGEPSIYVVESEDTISKVSKMLGVTENTVLAANDMNKKLKKDDVLFIPSVSGVEHTVTSKQTLKGIATFYKVDASDIAFCNDIALDAKIKTGDKFIIPGGQRVPEIVKPVRNLNQSIMPNTKYYGNYPIENLARLINPVIGYRLSQGLHDGNAVDLAIAKGTPIHATAAGRIIFAKMGYNGGFGGLVIIAHSNGVKTMYGHMSKIIVHAGDQVDQRQVIGYVGSTGRSTGPHVHFVVEGAPNPGVRGNWIN